MIIGHFYAFYLPCKHTVRHSNSMVRCQMSVPCAVYVHSLYSPGAILIVPLYIAVGFWCRRSLIFHSVLPVPGYVKPLRGLALPHWYGLPGTRLCHAMSRACKRSPTMGNQPQLEELLQIAEGGD